MCISKLLYKNCSCAHDLYLSLSFSKFCAKIKQHIRNAIEEERRLGAESLRDGKPIGVEEGI